ncbi:hypothetical protein LSH36_55g01029 [Paralvinella palmiformis]|uniref:Uncharacterized protein n=1 Tax=Paralvinella palmiformis TaxID=53620 RepID=A0AAD9NE89_9ANNE|nr:hypothetical protein LSH36_55g01029 [Paralvinella palmiformis]
MGQLIRIVLKGKVHSFDSSIRNSEKSKRPREVTRQTSDIDSPDVPAEDTRAIEMKKHWTPTPTAVPPIPNCRRCGAPEHSLGGGRRLANARPPNWFFSTRDTRSVRRLSSLDTAGNAIKDMARTELGHLQKVQEWLRRSYKYPQARPPPPTTTDGRIRDCPDEPLPPISGGSRRRDSERMAAGIGYGSDDDDVHEEAESHRIFPGIVPNEMRCADVRGSRRGFFGLNQEFTEYMMPNKSCALREDVGSILRPHTPVLSLSMRQRTIDGGRSYYGSRRDNKGQTTGQKIERQNRRIQDLRRQLEELIRK